MVLFSSVVRAVLGRVRFRAAPFEVANRLAGVLGQFPTLRGDHLEAWPSRQIFRGIVIKTDMTIPCTSVFLQLDCA